MAGITSWTNGEWFMSKRKHATRVWISISFCLLIYLSLPATAQCGGGPRSSQKSAQPVIIDTDIGDDIDDAFALAFALKSPELRVLGVSVTYGNTPMRARLTDRFLREIGCSNIPVALGEESPESTNPSQMNYALQEKESVHAAATDFLLKQIEANPGKVTLIAIGPLMNVGALIDKDPEAFRKLKRVVIMGGSIERHGSNLNGVPPDTPMAEHNIVEDIPDAQKLFSAGVPIYMMPLDSTHDLKLDEVKRRILFGSGSPITDQLTLLYTEWNAYARFGQSTPTLFDAMAVAFAIKPELCPTEAMHIRVDDKGLTHREAGPTNAYVCLNSDPNLFFSFLISRLLSVEK